jgi:hypothetical protein
MPSTDSAGAPRLALWGVEAKGKGSIEAWLLRLQGLALREDPRQTPATAPRTPLRPAELLSDTAAFVYAHSLLPWLSRHEVKNPASPLGAMSSSWRTAAASTLERHSDDDGKKGTARKQQCGFNHSHRSLPATKPLRA